MTFRLARFLLPLIVVLCVATAITTSGGGNSDRAGSVSVAPRTPTSSTPTTTVEPVTTTLAPEIAAGEPRPEPQVQQVPSPAAPQWPASLEPCGGDLPPCSVKWRESHGDYSARNNESAGAACGAWQVILSTYRSVMQRMGNEALLSQYPDACSAPPSLQDDVARNLWGNGAGCSAWAAC